MAVDQGIQARKTPLEAAPAEDGDAEYGDDSRVPRARRRVRAERDSLALILNLIRVGEATSRQELERRSGLSRAVVADRVARLIDRGLVAEGDLGPSTGGRAPRRIQFCADAGLLLVGYLGTSSVGVALADLSGRLLLEHHEAIDISRDPGETIGRIDALVEWLLDERRADRQVWGICIGVPGPVETVTSGSTSRPVLHISASWDEFPLRDHFASLLNAPVWIENDVHMMALGELRSAQLAGEQDLIFLNIDAGIEAGICSGGRLHRGAQGSAGYIGHTSVGDGVDVVCRCGNVGCLEAVAGGDALARDGRSAAASGRSGYLAAMLDASGTITAADVGIAAQHGDPFSAELLARAGRYIGTATATLVDFYNPALIVLGGDVVLVGDVLLAAVREAVYRYSYPLATRDLRIVRSEMGSSAALVGSALMVVDRLFSPDTLRQWVDGGVPMSHPEIARGVARANSRAGAGRPVPPVAPARTHAGRRGISPAAREARNAARTQR
jgi:predicted NBD/HSP70 family sugar kinase